MGLSLIKVRIYGKEYHVGVEGGDVDDVLEKYHRPTTRFSLTGISPHHLIQCVNATLRPIVMKYYLGLLVIPFCVYFCVMMLSGEQNYILPFLRNVRNESHVVGIGE